MERGGTAATASATGAKVFGGSRLKSLFGISKGGARAPCAPPPESASGPYVHTSVRPSVLPWTAISQKCMDNIVGNFMPRSGMV